jgi:hypothetical protein
MSKQRPEQPHHGHGAEPLTIKPTVIGGGDLAILPGEETAEGAEPGPFGIKVMRIAGSGATNADPVRPALDARPASTPRSMTQAARRSRPR